MRKQIARRLAAASGFLVVAFVAAIAGCTDGKSPTADGGHLTLSLTPQFHLLSGNGSLSIQRASVVILDPERHDTIAGPFVTELNPDAPSWTLPVSFEVGAGRANGIAQVELMHVEGDDATTQWSGVTNQVSLTDALAAPVATDVNMYPGPVANLSVTSLRIDSLAAPLVEGDSVLLRTHVDGGNQAHIFWHASDTTIASVDGLGMVRGRRDGALYVRAEAGRGRDSLRIVYRARTSTILMTPDTIRASSIGDPLNFVAIAMDRRGAPVDGETLTWTSTNALVAQLSATPGQFVAAGDGIVTITARSQSTPSVFATAVALVKQQAASITTDANTFDFDGPGQTHAFHATLSDARGNRMGGTVQWQSGDAGVATVDNAGVVTSVASGSTAITASTPDGLSATVQISVRRRVASLTLAPQDLSFDAIGDTARITVTAHDATGAVVPGANVTWSSSSSTVATVDANGVVRSIGNGAAHIIAALDGVSASLTATVRQSPAAVVVTPDSIVADSGAAVTFAARATDRHGNAIDSVAFVWSSDDATIAANNGNGQFTASHAGTTIVRASTLDAGESATARLIVRAPDHPASVVISPSAGTVTKGQDFVLSATVTGASIPTTGPASGVTWKSLNTVIADVDVNGKVHGKTVGRVIITATAKSDPSLTDSATIDVVDAGTVPTTITLSVPSLSWSPGDTVPLTVHIDGTSSAVAAGAHYTSSNNAVAHVDPTGIVTAVGSGTATITATAAADPTARASVTITVGARFITVAVLPQTGTVTQNKDYKLTALVAHDVTGPGGGVTWKSESGTLATVDPSGKVHAVAVGTAVIVATSKADPTQRDSAIVIIVAPGAIPTVVTASPDSATLAVGDSTTIAASLDGTTAVISAGFTFTAAPPGTVRVDSLGHVVSLLPGTATITIAAAGDPAIRATSIITVFAPDLTVAIDRDSATVFKGQSLQLSATVTHDGTGPRSGVTWTASNKAVADVDPKGLVKAVAAGVDTIFAVSKYDPSQRALAVITVTNVPIIPTTISGAPQTAPMNVGDSLAINAQLDGSPTVIAAGLRYTSNNNKVATVAATGMIKAVTPGTAIITITAAGDGTAKVTTTIIVTDPRTSVAVTPAIDTLTEDASTQMSATVVNDGTGPQSGVTWTSSNPSIADVDGNGLVRGKKPGTVTITATSKYDISKQATAQVTVTSHAPITVTLSADSATLLKGTTLQLTAIVSNDGSGSKSGVTWLSSNKPVADVDQNGLVHAKAAGTDTIYATSNADPSVRARTILTVTDVVVSTPDISVTLALPIATVAQGKTIQLSAIVANDRTGPQSGVTWTTSDPAIATVDPSGKVQGKAIGLVTITATSKADPTKASAAAITVVDPAALPTVVVMTPLVAAASVGDTILFAATITGTTAATVGGVRFQSSDNTVARVDSTGSVIAVSPGRATITATSVYEGGIKATSVITVTDPRVAVTVSQPIATMVNGQTLHLSATVTNDATTPGSSGVTWTSSDTSTADVDINGNVHAKKIGVVTITATSKWDPSKTASAVVTIVP